LLVSPPGELLRRIKEALSPRGNPSNGNWDFGYWSEWGKGTFDRVNRGDGGSTVCAHRKTKKGVECCPGDLKKKQPKLAGQKSLQGKQLSPRAGRGSKKGVTLRGGHKPSTSPSQRTDVVSEKNQGTFYSKECAKGKRKKLHNPRKKPCAFLALSDPERLPKKAVRSPCPLRDTGARQKDSWFTSAPRGESGTPIHWGGFLSTETEKRRVG